MTKKTKFHSLALLISVAATLTGCGTTGPSGITIPAGSVIDLQAIVVRATPAANNFMPVAVDFVFVYDMDALKRLQGYNARGWFSARSVNLIDWGDKTQWINAEMEPGSEKVITEFPRGPGRPLAVVVYANYQNPGLHRQIIVSAKRLEVRLEQNGFMVGGE
jgi:type VI secretion system protein